MRTITLGRLMGSILAVTCLVDAQAADASAAKRTIGLVLTQWRPAIYETQDGKEECPSGLQQANRENWLAQFPTDQERSEVIRKYLYLGPNAPGGGPPDQFLQNRGPDGQMITWNPTLAKDLVPLREVEGTKGYGLNLDGTEDGHATARTCAHKKFRDPDTNVAVDNQLYRILGCAMGWRKSGFMVSYHTGGPGSPGQFQEIPLNRVLIAISDVDDERNDDQVEVVTYKGLDRLVFDAAGVPVPFLTQRIDIRYPRYMSRTSGRIVDGILKTDPVDARYAMLRMNAPGEQLIRDMRMELKLGAVGAEGLIAGYDSVEEWYAMYAKSYVPVVDSIGLWSPPSLYEAARRLADGFPDASGQCTALSVAYRVEAVKAFIVEPPVHDPLQGTPRRTDEQVSVSAR